MCLGGRGAIERGISENVSPGPVIGNQLSHTQRDKSKNFINTYPDGKNKYNFDYNSDFQQFPLPFSPIIIISLFHEPSEYISIANIPNL